MTIPENTLQTLAYLLLLVNGLTDALVSPLFDKFKLDKFWIKYVVWLEAGGMTYLTGLNVFEGTMAAYPLVGRILTAVFAGVIVGVGANKLHDATDKNEASYSAYSGLAEMFRIGEKYASSVLRPKD